MPSSSQCRKNIADLAKKRAEVERKIADAQGRKARKEKEAADKRARASRSSGSMSNTYLRQSDSAQKAALAEGDRISALSKGLGAIAAKESKAQKDLADAIKMEATAQARADDKARRDRLAAEKKAEQQRKSDARQRQHDRVIDQQAAASLVAESEQRLAREIESIRPPRKEELRILYATANPLGDLRVDQEIRRVKAVVRASTHRDQVVIEHLSAATAGDLLDSLTEFRPHVVHFSGHANNRVLVFDDGTDEGGKNVVTARSFKAAVEAPDDPPLLVVLNACESAAQLSDLIGRIPAAIGMTDSVGDIDAITFATRFYRSVAEGQSVAAALALARADMEMNGLPDHDLPTLVTVPGLDPSDLRLVVLLD